MAASNLYYIKILGIQPDFTIDDITAYFQTARCGSGIVQEVIYLDAKKSAVLIGIEGLNDKCEYPGRMVCSCSHCMCSSVSECGSSGFLLMVFVWPN